MKNLDAKFYLKLGCFAVLLGLFLFVINMPLHRVESKDYAILNYTYSYKAMVDYDDTYGKHYIKHLNRIYDKYNDKYVKAKALTKIIQTSTNGEIKLKRIRELEKLNVPISYLEAEDIINVLNFYGHYDEVYYFAKKVKANHNSCHDFYSTAYNMITCKIDILFNKDKRQNEMERRIAFEDFINESEYYSVTPLIDKKLVMMVPNVLASGNPGNWSDIDYAKFYYSRNNLSKAVYYFDKASVPGYYYIRCGEDYMARGNYKKAVECFNKFFKYTSSPYYIPNDLTKAITVHEYKRGSYKLHKKMYDCYLRLDDKKSAEKHKKIMQEILSW